MHGKTGLDSKYSIQCLSWPKVRIPTWDGNYHMPCRSQYTYVRGRSRDHGCHKAAFGCRREECMWERKRDKRSQP
jgi:hypothetical protein